MMRRFVFGALLISWLITACAVNTPTPSSSDLAYPVALPTSTLSANEAYPTFRATPILTPVAPMEAPPPQPGKGSISGVLYAYAGVTGVLRGTTFYLTPAIGEDKRQIPPFLYGPDTNQGDIISITADDTGFFALDNVPPGNYFIVVWAPLNWIPAEVSPTVNQARIVEVTEGGQNALGVLYLAWP